MVGDSGMVILNLLLFGTDKEVVDVSVGRSVKEEGGEGDGVGKWVAKSSPSAFVGYSESA